MFPVLQALLHAITHTFFLSQLKCHPLLAAFPALPEAVPSPLMPLGFSHFSLCGDHRCLSATLETAPSTGPELCGATEIPVDWYLSPRPFPTCPAPCLHLTKSPLSQSPCPRSIPSPPLKPGLDNCSPDRIRLPENPCGNGLSVE